MGGRTRNSCMAVLAWLILAGVTGASLAAPGLSLERAGLGLKPPTSSLPWSGGLLATDAVVSMWQPLDTGETVYTGTRESTRLGLHATESYSGIYHPLGDAWGASLEVGVMPETAWAPRRYSLTGQVHTALAAGGGLSVGLKYRAYQPDVGFRASAPGDFMPWNSYSLAPLRSAGAGTSYQLQLSYQYNASNVFGFTLGRELETFTGGLDAPGAGSRQFMFTGQHWLTPSWAFSYDLLSNDPGSVRLQGLRLGVRYRF